MTLLANQLKVLQVSNPGARATPLPSGAQLIEIPGVKFPEGWNRQEDTVFFLAPPGYPAARPDCFWVGQCGLRLANGGIAANTNDANPIPEVGPKGTWFSWHLQNWDPSNDSLLTYFNVIRQRLNPAR